MDEARLGQLFARDRTARDLVALDHLHAQARPRQVRRRNQPVVAGADHDHVVDLSHRLRGRQAENRRARQSSAPAEGLTGARGSAGGRSSAGWGSAGGEGSAGGGSSPGGDGFRALASLRSLANAGIKCQVPGPLALVSASHRAA